MDGEEYLIPGTRQGHSTIPPSSIQHAPCDAEVRPNPIEAGIDSSIHMTYAPLPHSKFEFLNSEFRVQIWSPAQLFEDGSKRASSRPNIMTEGRSSFIILYPFENEAPYALIFLPCVTGQTHIPPFGRVE